MVVGIVAILLAMSLVGFNLVVAGTISDIWVDRSEPQIRYLEVKVGEGRHCLLPINFARIRPNLDQVLVDAITGAQFANVPVLGNPDEITFLEEDMVCAYYGAGKLYATAERSEAII